MRPSAAELASVFKLDIETGKMYRDGKEAGSPTYKYWLIQYKGTRYTRAMLSWTIFNGRWPQKTLDHINRNSFDDRPANLREVTNSQNNYNRGLFKKNKSGYPGVRLEPRNNTPTWQATCDGKHLGMFATFEEALAARLAAERRRSC